MLWLIGFQSDELPIVENSIGRYTGAAQEVCVTMDPTVPPQGDRAFLAIAGPDWPKELAERSGDFVRRFLEEAELPETLHHHGQADPEWDAVLLGRITDNDLAATIGRVLAEALGIPDLCMIISTTALRRHTEVSVRRIHEPLRAGFPLRIDDAVSEAIMETGRFPDGSAGILDQIRWALEH